MASDVRHPEAPTADRRADVARLQLRLRQAKRRLAEAEDGSVSDSEAARAALVAQLGPMLDQRRLSMDAELETARAAAERRRDAASREAIQIVERAEQAVRERALRDQAEQTLREQAALELAAREAAVREIAEHAAAREEAEVALREQQARESAVRRAAHERAAEEQAAIERQAREEAEQALREQEERQRASRSLHERAERARRRMAEPAAQPGIPNVAPILDPRYLPTVQIVDGPVERELAPWVPGSAQVVRPTPIAVSNALPAAGMNDPEVFARAVATVLTAVMGERGVAAPPQVVMQAPVPHKNGFWANARHLDVLLLGFTTVVVLVVLAAWLA